MSRSLCYLVEIIPDEQTHWSENHEARLKLDLRLLIGQAVRIHSSGSLPAVNVIPVEKAVGVETITRARDFA